MKLILVFIFYFFCYTGFSQTQSDSLIQEVSRRSANRMKDSLKLNPAQGNELYKANLLINKRKLEARQLYGADRQIIGRKIQEAESMRDSLYSRILTPEVFNRYKLKKGELLVQGN
jgi:hypothetical protein